MRTIRISAEYDPKASVWVAESADIPLLITEADTVEALLAKLPGMISDLIEDDSRDVIIDLTTHSTESVALPV